jgi:hypothetical protein
MTFVLGFEHAAGGVNQAPARLHQTPRGSENRALLGTQLGNARRCLPPLQVRIATQGPQTGTRRIDQDPIELAGKAPDLGVPLGVDAHRMHVRQTGAGKAGLQSASRRSATSKA